MTMTFDASRVYFCHLNYFSASYYVPTHTCMHVYLPAWLSQDQMYVRTQLRIKRKIHACLIHPLKDVRTRSYVLRTHVRRRRNSTERKKTASISY